MTNLRGARRLLLLALALLLAGCGATRTEAAEGADPGADAPGRAIFAAGCFWCVEEAFERIDGVREVISGYTGGDARNPSYRQVTAGGTGHHEAVEVRYDPEQVDYAELLSVFWRNVDPTDDRGQFCDRGPSYRGAVFPLDDAQRAAASKGALQEDPRAPTPIVTPILDAGRFWRAEDYHQDYYRKNPLRYRFYKNACGRAARLEELWGEYEPTFAGR